MTTYESMLAAYGRDTGSTATTNAEQEACQKIALAGLHRGGFFDHAAFYGGTCLRLFYGLPRFSEDMGFSLTEKPMKGSVIQRRVAAMDYPNSGKLAGLVECARMDNITINALAIKMKVSPHTVIRAFEAGDIKISVLKRMARALEIEVKWNWVPLS